MTRLQRLVLVLGLASLPVLGYTAFGQAVGDKPIKGTIPVEKGVKESALMDMAKITLEQARDAALAAVPGATFKEGDLETEDGFLVYEIELIENGKEVDVLVDAGDASVLEVDYDD